MGDRRAGSVDHKKRLACLDQRHQKRRIAPSTLVPRVGDALFALGIGLRKSAIDINHSLFAEGSSLTLPDFNPDLVESLLQLQNRRLVEASQEITCRRRSGYPF